MMETYNYITKQTDSYKDKRLSEALMRAFVLMVEIEDDCGCITTSVMLYLTLKELGYNPKMCYGLCKLKGLPEFYHAWLELDGKIIDIAIYGNINYNPLIQLFGGSSVVMRTPIVMEGYNTQRAKYQRFVFDSAWRMAAIRGATKMTIGRLFREAPSEQIYKSLARIMGTSLSRAKQIVNKYADISISEYEKELGC